MTGKDIAERIRSSSMGLRDIGATLPPGFRFYPSDEELVCHYLYKKIANEEALKGTLVEIDLHTCEPWQLPEVAKLNANEWYFFSFRDRKYATGFRTNRATITGYWKATGKDRTVHEPVTHEIVGMRKTLVFYRNRAPNGIKTGWIMHEFRLETPHMPPKEDWVLCRVFHRSKGASENLTGSNIDLSHHNFMMETTMLNPPSNNTALMPRASPYQNYDVPLSSSTVSSCLHQNNLISCNNDNNNANDSPMFHLLHHLDSNTGGDITSKAVDEMHGLFWGSVDGISPNNDLMRIDLGDDGAIFQ